MKSDLVVAVEANPQLCNETTDKFKNEILEGRLIVENCIVTTDKKNSLKDSKML